MAEADACASAPPFVRGIFNLRGTIVPVIDIAFTEGQRGDLPPKHVVVALLPRRMKWANCGWESRSTK